MSESAGKLTDNLWERDRLIPTWVTQGNRPIGDRDSDMRKRGKQTYNISLFPCAPSRYHAPRSVCFLLRPMSVSRSHIMDGGVTPTWDATENRLFWERDTDMGHNRKRTDRGA